MKFWGNHATPDMPPELQLDVEAFYRLHELLQRAIRDLDARSDENIDDVVLADD